jgi:hypothetical protein
VVRRLEGPAGVGALRGSGGRPRSRTRARRPVRRARFVAVVRWVLECVIATGCDGFWVWNAAELKVRSEWFGRR